jgi:hypothetical protein
MTAPRVAFRLDLPWEALTEERAAAGPLYHLGPAEPLPPDPETADTRFAVTLIATATVPLLAGRLVRHWLTRRGEGVMIDLRESPPRLSQIAGVPQRFIVLVHRNGRAETVRAVEEAPLAELLGKVLRTG